MSNRKSVLKGVSRSCPIEYDECIELVKRFDAANLTYVHVPNEGNRSPIAGKRLRNIGLQTGFSDYLVFSNCKFLAPGLALEMKRISGSTIEPNQYQWRDKMLALGWNHIFGFGYEDAIRKMRRIGWNVTMK